MSIVSRRNVILAALCAAVLAAGAGGSAGARPASSCSTRRSPSATPRRPSPRSSRRIPASRSRCSAPGTTEVMGKLAAEFAAGAPKADVLLLADAASMEALKKDGRLLAVSARRRSTGSTPGTYDADRTYFGSKLITTGIAVNTAAKTPSRVVGRSREARVQGSDRDAEPALFRRRGDHARHDDRARPDLGWSYFEKLKAGDAVAVRGNGAVLTAVANGEKPYGVLVDFMAFNAKAKGSPIDFIFPAEGVPAVTEPVAILKTTQNAGGRARVRRFHPVRRRTEARGRDGLHPGQGERRHAGVVAGGREDQADADRHRARSCRRTAPT